jgi:ElaB/YqjD/DUF883 family membrane-anchored ribosome-binding protein
MLCIWASEACGVSDATDQLFTKLVGFCFFREVGIMHHQLVHHYRPSYSAWSLGATFHPAWSRGEGRRLRDAETGQAVDTFLVAVYEKRRESRETTSEKQVYKHPLLSGSLQINGEAVRRLMDWRKSLVTDSREYVEAFEAELKARQKPVTAEQLQHIRQQLGRWLDDQRQDATAQLERLPDGIAKGLREMIDRGLDRLSDRMWTDMLAIVQQHNERVQHSRGRSIPKHVAIVEYVDWRKEVRSASAEFLEAFENSMRTMGRVTDEQKKEMRQQLGEWLGDKRSDLTERLEVLPRGIVKRIMKWADRSLKLLQERMWQTMEEAVRRHNASIPPVDPPPIDPPPIGQTPVTLPPALKPNLPGLPADGLFITGTIRLEITRGKLLSTLNLQDLSAARGKKAIFYVADTAGNRKAVTLSFSDLRLQNEVEKRFKQSAMYGKTVSLEKFNRFVQRLKSSLEDITETDLERLRSRLYGKEENAKLDTHIRTFISIVYQISR